MQKGIRPSLSPTARLVRIRSVEHDHAPGSTRDNGDQHLS